MPQNMLSPPLVNSPISGAISPKNIVQPVPAGLNTISVEFSAQKCPGHPVKLKRLCKITVNSMLYKTLHEGSSGVNYLNGSAFKDEVLDQVTELARVLKTSFVIYDSPGEAGTLFPVFTLPSLKE